MHATLWRMKCAPGKVDQVADLIESEYLPKLADLDGVVSYTLVQTGDDEVTSLGVFTSGAGATVANGLAQMWVDDRLSGLAANPPETRDGPVLLHAALPS